MQRIEIGSRTTRLACAGRRGVASSHRFMMSVLAYHRATLRSNRASRR